MEKEQQRDTAETKLDRIYDAIVEMRVDIGKLIVNHENIAMRTAQSEKRIEKVEKRPAQRWEAMMMALIGAAAVAAFAVLSGG